MTPRQRQQLDLLQLEQRRLAGFALKLTGSLLTLAFAIRRENPALALAKAESVSLQ